MRTSWIAIGALCLSCQSIAESFPVNDWVVETYGQAVEAFTGNDSGSTFGLFCAKNSCFSYIDVNIKCVEDDKATFLLNSDSGASHLITDCTHLSDSDGTRYLYTFQDKVLFEAMSKGEMISFAIPLHNAQFRVVRFSLKGAVEATKKALQFMKELDKKSIRFDDLTL